MPKSKMNKTGAGSSRNKDNVELLREMGGVAFMYNLSKSTIVHSDVTETAVFTLGTLAEANVYCKNSLCRKETFADLAGSLMKDDIPLTQKRVSVYFLSVLVANNKEAQQICVAAFPIIKIWLQHIAVPSKEIFQPICSFIAMAVANNGALASGLAQYGIVSHLISLLGSPNLDPEDRLSVLLSLVHCTEATVEHQSHLVQCGGLPLIITLLTEDTSEEVRKVATFILQTCKQATLSLKGPGLIMKQGEGENAENVTEMEGFRSSARELLHRIDLLEKRQEAKHGQQDTDLPTSAKGLSQPSPGPALSLHLQSVKTIPTAYRQTPTLYHVKAGGDNHITLQTVRSMTTKESGSKPKNCPDTGNSYTKMLNGF
ncbi:Telomere repeats-binding bouquet formation protein 1 [Channa argus]|uniref:Telomere repeats-binding bouquet formation protein 1 n=1 Tax=Channa argus TaxID=215402 RepID=A0A6G1PF20_CHAAH|nr:Telomere repeats-binding bouquet formation protein 1 [Channa argus]